MDKSEHTPYMAYGMGFVFLAKEERALHEDMTIYAYGPALGMNAGIVDMTEAEIAARFKAEFTALTSIYGRPKKQIGERV